MWKARSHAAYHGYSHLSGMEMTSPLYMWNQSALRDLATVRVQQRVGVVLLEPLVDVEQVVLLAPQHAGQRLTEDQSLVVSERGRRHASVELIGLRSAGGERRVEVRAKGRRSRGQSVGARDADG